MGFHYGRSLVGLLLTVPLGLSGLLVSGTAGAWPTTDTTTTTTNAVSMGGGDASTSLNSEHTARTVADTQGEQIINGNFSYLGASALGLRTTADTATSFVGVDRRTRTQYHCASGNRWTALPGGFDANRFGWDSTETNGTPDAPTFCTNQRHANGVELQLDISGNIYGEITAAQKNTALYQTLTTTKGVSYRVKLRHASKGREHVDSMRVVMVAADGSKTYVPMTRTTSNGHGDKTGVKSTIISTKVTTQIPTNSKKRSYEGQWEWYEGMYIATSNKTRFTFEAVSSQSGVDGNLIDDVSFSKAYPLAYDANGGTKNGTSPIAYTGNETDTNQHVTSTVADTVTAEKIINGSFDYPTIPANKWLTLPHGHTDTNKKFLTLNPPAKVAGRGCELRTGKERFTLNGFDINRFGWTSSQTTTPSGDGKGNVCEAKNVELNRESNGNVFAEITADVKNTAIYQDMHTQATTPVQYRVRLRHSSSNNKHVDSMQVLVGKPGSEQPVRMTRTTSNGHGDKVGETSTIIATRVTNTDNSKKDGQWEWYEGTVTIPANQLTTRFTFKAVSSLNWYSGNDVDDISFSKAYPLAYDANGGVKNTVSPISTIMRDDDEHAALTVANTRAALPDHIVNGDFSTYGNRIIDIRSSKASSVRLTFVSGTTGNVMALSSTVWPKLAGFDPVKFAWRSTDKTENGKYGNIVEVQRALGAKTGSNGNVWGEIAAATQGKYIYQDIATTPGVLYKWQIKHASRNTTHNDAMQVIIGGKPQAATRVTVNGLGDKTGSVGTTIRTKGIADKNQWETYEGQYVATSTTTRFTFKSLNDSHVSGVVNRAEGNLVDDISFQKAYPLGYDANGGKKTSTSPISDTITRNENKPTVVSAAYTQTSDMTTDTGEHITQTSEVRSDGSVRVQTVANNTASGCQVYYPAGTVITLATAQRDGDCWDSSMISRNPYLFYGWSETRINPTKIANTLNSAKKLRITMPASAKTVYAIWAQPSKLSYDVNLPTGESAPGTVPQPKLYQYGSVTSDTSGWSSGQKILAHYKFKGWTTTRNGNTMFQFGRTLGSDTTVYALWEPISYTIIFSANTDDASGSTQPMTLKWGDVKNLSKNGFDWPGHTFTGWKRRDNNQPYTDQESVTNLSDTDGAIIYMDAQWSATPAHVNYYKNAADATGVTTGWNGSYGDKVTIAQNGFTRPGYVFVEWCTKGGTDSEVCYDPEDSWTQSVAPGQTLTAGGAAGEPLTAWPVDGTLAPSLSLYAIWKRAPASLSYNGNGGDGDMQPDTGEDGDPIQVQSNGFTYPGYTFKSWNTESNGSGTRIDPGDPYTLHGNVTVYAQWKPNKVTLTYKPNGATGGSTPPDEGVMDGDTDVRENGFTWPGHTFIAWNTEPDGSGTPYDRHNEKGSSLYFFTKPDGNVLYAQWEANDVTLTYKPNGATGGSMPSPSGKVGDDVYTQQNQFTWPGHTFTGWNTKPDGTGDDYGDPSVLKPPAIWVLQPDGNILYAQWEENPAVIHYEDGTDDPRVTGSTPDTTGLIDIPVTIQDNGFTRPGYRFTGWGDQPNQSDQSEVKQPGDQYTPTQAETTLYAQWEINTVHLNFDANGGEGSYVSLDGDAFTTLTIPPDANGTVFTRIGYRFDGWMLDPHGTTADYQPTEPNNTVPMQDKDITLYAKWVPTTVTLPLTGGRRIPISWAYAGAGLLALGLCVMIMLGYVRMARRVTGRHRR